MHHAAAGFLNDDDRILPSGFNGTAVVSIPLLDITDSRVDIYVGTGVNKGKLFLSVSQPPAKHGPQKTTALRG